MDIDRIRYFIAVCDTGSLRQASEIVFKTPPALSKAIKTLERETGFKLIVPAGRGIEITKVGRELARRMKPVLEEMDRIRSEVGGHGGSNVLRIGSFEVFTTHFLGELMKRAALKEDLVLRELIPGEMEQALLQGEIDLGITYLPIPSPKLEVMKVASIEMGMFARSGALDGLPFPKIPFVVPVQPLYGTPTKVQGLDGWPDGKLERFIRYRVALMESALELCRQGLAAAYLPTFIARLHNKKVTPPYRLSSLRLPKKIRENRQAVYLIRRRSEPKSETLKKIVEILRAVC